MLVETSVPGSDDWWLVRVADKLGEGLPRMAELTAYRDGDAMLPQDAMVDKGTRESYLRFCRRSRLHVVETIRDARTDRQSVVGFRTGSTGDENGDTAAWRIWRSNRMQSQSHTLFNDIADYSEAFILTAPDDVAGDPVWTLWNGWNAAVITDTTRPWRTETGVTYGYDPISQAEVLTLYRPGYVRFAYRESRQPSLGRDGSVWSMGRNWSWSDRVPTPWTQEALLHRAATPDGFGVWEKHKDTIDRINEITLNAITVIVTQAFRQRGVKGNLPEFYPEGHPQAGQRIDYDELFKAGPAALWMLPIGADIWESAVTDVRPIYEARKSEIQALSSLTRTPQDIFNGESQNQSAMGAEIAREPLTYAVKRMNDHAEVALAQAMAQSFASIGDTVRADVADIEVLWGKVNPATLAEKAEAGAKLAGVATQRWIDSEVLELTPTERRQAELDRTTEAFQAAVAAQAGQPGVTDG